MKVKKKYKEYSIWWSKNCSIPLFFIFVLNNGFELLNIHTLACQVTLSIGMDRYIRNVSSLITLKQSNKANDLKKITLGLVKKV